MGELVHEGDVEVALRVLDDLGGFRHFYRRRPVQAGGDDRAVNSGDDVEGESVLRRYHLLDRFEAVRPVTRIDALRRVANCKIASGRKARDPFKDRHAVLFRCAGIDGGLVDHHIAPLERPSHRF